MLKQDVAIRVSKRFRKILLVACAGVFLSVAARAFPSDSEPCSTNPDSRQLDFWLGDWSVGGPGAGPSAVSKVSAELDRCMVVERWDGGRGHRGENIFGYSPDDKSWHGLFADNTGRVHVFVNGKVATGTAEFTGPSRGPNGETILNRVRIKRVGADKVEQTWEKSADKGATWKLEFRGEYLRKQ
jgi:hypothetical protein